MVRDVELHKQLRTFSLPWVRLLAGMSLNRTA